MKLSLNCHCIPSYLWRCIHYFIFTMAAIIVCIGLLLTQKKEHIMGEYVVVTGVLVLMIGVLLISKEYRLREPLSRETSQMDTSPLDDPPPVYSDSWRESYLKDQKEKAESDPPPPPYRESWSKGLWKKYCQIGRYDHDNSMHDLSVATIYQEVENDTLPSTMNDVSRLPYVLQENDYWPQISPSGNSSGSEILPLSPTSLLNGAPDLEGIRTNTAVVSASDFTERLETSSATQFPSLSPSESSTPSHSVSSESKTPELERLTASVATLSSTSQFPSPSLPENSSPYSSSSIESNTSELVTITASVATVSTPNCEVGLWKCSSSPQIPLLETPESSTYQSALPLSMSGIDDDVSIISPSRFVDIYENERRS